MRNRVVNVAVLTLAMMGTMSLIGGVAAAAPGPTPNGLTGACNMINAHALPGMLNAMGHDNAQGTAGMWNAISHSDGNC